MAEYVLCFITTDYRRIIYGGLQNTHAVCILYRYIILGRKREREKHTRTHRTGYTHERVYIVRIYNDAHARRAHSGRVRNRVLLKKKYIYINIYLYIIYSYLRNAWFIILRT